MKKISYLFFLLFAGITRAQQETKPLVKFPEFKKTFNEEGTTYIKFTGTAQFWERYIDYNPGTTLNGYTNVPPFDLGIRRLRFNMMAQFTNRTFFYVQFGQNNFTYTSKLYTGAFVHDAVGEYRVHPTKLTIGGGLTGWSGLTRFASPSVASILGVDAPLYQQATNGITDQFLRKLSVYAKGKLGKFDYRVALSKPMTAQNSSVTIPDYKSLPVGVANYNLAPPKVQAQGYFMYQFWDQEDNTLCYTNGSYYGKKKILNIGAGFIEQENAMWHKEVQGTDTLKKNDNMILLGTDVFFEKPLSDKHNTITAYVAYTDYRMGKNYVRNNGLMNPAFSTNSLGTFAGGGNAYPMLGTGQTIYVQVGYRFKDNLVRDNGTFQPYASVQYSKLQALKDPMIVYDAGVNWLIHGDNKSKLTVAYQSRPIFTKDTQGDERSTSRKGMLILQYQIAF